SRVDVVALASSAAQVERAAGAAYV
ncbi:MAG: hypothetical protein QOH34_3506, partial [Mycobacterium sp.]|nr:hypothetical protein [Mycobacterium sp.]